MTRPAHSRYPHYDVLSKWASPDWDEPTRAALHERLYELPPIRFFSDSERRLLEAIAERIVPQADRDVAGRIPIVPWIDARLFRDEREGYRYEGLPPQREAWRAGLAAIGQTAAALFDGTAFTDLDGARQDRVLRSVERGDPPGELWAALPAACFFTHVLCAAIVKVYYAHPRAWSETGYSGPSSPRGHMRIWEGGVDPWEPQEEQPAGSGAEEAADVRG
jgi:gluconate 2-dehydrogenase subunit 3-like protein